MTSRQFKLPTSWTWATFDDVAAVESNLVDPSDHMDAPHVAPNNIESGTGRLLPYQTVRADGIASPNHFFRPGQILYSKIRPYLAKVVRVDFEGLCSADMYPVRSDIDAGFLHWWLVSPMFTAFASESQSRTVLPKINQQTLATKPVPVAPLNEQKRIVAKIEALQARSDAAKQALDAIPPLLEQLRQSVLAAAFRGDLTRAWREAHPDVEPASELLERIRAERRRKWEEANPKKKYVEPEAVDDKDLSELPRGWCWASFDEVGDLMLGRRRAPEYHDEAVEAPYLRVANVKPDRLALDDVLSMRWSTEDAAKYRLDVGDILISEGQSLERIGQSAMVSEAAAGMLFQSTLHRMRLNPRLVQPRYAQLVSLNATANGTFRQFASITTNIAHLTLAKLQRVPFPLCSRGEQEALVTAADAVFASIQGMIGALSQAKGRHETLTQSILAKAFRGELVPQDPTDEPASALLDRIRAERESTAAKPKPAKAAKTARAAKTASPRKPKR